MKKNAYEFYKPIIVKDIKVDWITGETIPSGETWIMITKKFISSLEENFYTYSTNMLSLFIWGNIWDHLNRILIIIKEDNTAKIYRKFPMSVWIIAKQDIKAGSLIWKRQIADIESIEFNDSEYEIEIEQWDKIIWLFRIDWRFWLYFDFSKTLNPTNLSKELGSCYRSLAYYNLYSFLDDKDNFDFLLQDWWFPFIQINDERFERLIQYYKEEKKFTEHRIILSQTDRYYLFTDGFIDQFGGALDRKFLPKRFKEILMKNGHHNMEMLKRNLKENLKNWMDDVEQIDDILVLGFSFDFNKF